MLLHKDLFSCFFWKTLCLDPNFNHPSPFSLSLLSWLPYGMWSLAKKWYGTRCGMKNRERNRPPTDLSGPPIIHPIIVHRIINNFHINGRHDAWLSPKQLVKEAWGLLKVPTHPLRMFCSRPLTPRSVWIYACMCVCSSLHCVCVCVCVYNQSGLNLHYIYANFHLVSLCLTLNSSSLLNCWYELWYNIIMIYWNER